MGGRMRLHARRVCFVAAGVCLLVAVGVPSSHAQEVDSVPRPEVFRGSASSQVASVQVDRGALLPVSDVFRFVALDGASTYESSSRQARSSLLFPGNGLILGPSLACGTFGGQLPEQLKPVLAACLQYKYPLTVFADDFAPDGATAGSLALGSPTDPVSGNAVRARAHAGEDAATTDAVVQDLRVLGLPALGALTLPIPGVETDTSLLTIDSASSRTAQRIVKGVLVTDAESTLSGIRMIGGLIRIASLRSESHVTDDAHGKRTAVPTLEVSGVTVGGVPAQITDKGLVLGPSGASSPLDQQRQSQLNELLQALHIKVSTLVAQQTTDDDGAAVASVGGLLIELDHDVEGLPTVPGPLGDLDPNGLYTASIQLASTAVLGSAVTFGADAVESQADVPYVGDGSPDLGSSGFDGSVDAASPTFSEAPVPARHTSTANSQLARSLDDTFGDRLGMLYLALMLAVLGCCIAPALTVPARFGRFS